MPPRPTPLTIVFRRGSRIFTTRNTLPLHHRQQTCHHQRTMSTQGPPADSQAQAPQPSTTTTTTTDNLSFASIGIKNTEINTAPDVTLTPQQKVLVGSILDIFEGHPSLKHFSLWSPNATFTDPLTVATGHAKYTAQFYGLPALFKPIQIQHHRVTSAGNPLELELSNKYVVKGIKKEQTMNSVVKVFIGEDGKVERLEDRWNGKLPEGAISDAFRKLNAVTVPAFVKVPKTEEEDMKMKAEREKA